MVPSRKVFRHSFELVTAQAKYFFENLEFEGKFGALRGWLVKFKNRYGIREISIQGEKISANVDAAKNFVTELMQFIGDEQLTLEQIYNADDSGLN